MKQLFTLFYIFLNISFINAQKIYVTDTEAWAGWKKTSKKYLLE